MGLVEKQLGRRVAAQRNLAHLTQEALAEKIGVSAETVSRLERGVVIPSVARLERIAAALGTELRELFSFRPAGSKDAALERLLAAARRRSVADIELLVDLATRFGGQ